MSSNQTAIEVVKARTHNLKGVSCRVPHRRVTVVTGPSGAGKSSLAFDTVYAEAQRRFVESMSTYARQFLEQMERPPIEAMYNILPAVALEARNSVKNARSTVGTLTEVYDVLRLVYAYLGEVHCPACGGEVESATSQEVADAIARGDAGEKVVLVAPLERPAKNADLKLRELVRQGYFRRLKEDGEIERMTPAARWLKRLDPLYLVLGRFTASGEPGSRLAGAVEEAYALAGGRLEAHDVGTGHVRHYGRALTCPGCGTAVRRPVPALFSFNSPLGACDTCQGFGRVIGVDPARVVPDPTKSLRERAIAPWNSPAYEDRYAKLYAACADRGIDLDAPWEELSEAERRFVWSGRGRFTNLDKFFRWLERRNYKVHVRVLLARYRAYNPCPDCRGLRLGPDALAVTLKGESLPELTARSIEDLRRWLERQRFGRAERKDAGYLLDELDERLETLHRVGLDYLTLDRQARTLSGGEAQRIQLAAALGSGLTSTLYVLDEPTIGLHPQDSERLLALLRDLARRGNTVLVVEHDRTLIRGADHVIDLGPYAGERGGEVVAEGTLDDILESEASLTARYLHNRDPSPTATSPGGDALPLYQMMAAEQPRFTIRNATANNLRGFDVEMPHRALVGVTGVSGSGKSTLVENVLYGTYQRSRGTVDVEPGECAELAGLEGRVDDVVLVDQRPLGRSTRSNPVTYVKAYDVVRRLFADTDEARRRRVGPGHFSFNRDLGRCPECQGTGVLEIDMHFMAAVTVVCDACQGRRFRPEVLAVTYRGRNVHETLELTVDQALEVFEDIRPLCRRLKPLVDAGLGYLRLGQPTSTLSGGEAQRLKLASFLAQPAGKSNRLFLFDEPTTGLHMSDVWSLTRTFRKLQERGHGVVVVEHNVDLLAEADWIVDLGPGGGVHGGELLYSGPTEPFVAHADTPTAHELRRHLGRRRTRKRPKSKRRRKAASAK